MAQLIAVAVESRKLWAGTLLYGLVNYYAPCPMVGEHSVIRPTIHDRASIRLYHLSHGAAA